MLLEDGTRLDGELCGAPPARSTGEVVFNTAMTGYQEAVTDPSYAGQIITFTYPLIGNYGVSAAAMESDRVHARAVIMRDAKNGEDAADRRAAAGSTGSSDCGVPGDHRASTRARSSATSATAGAMRGGIFSADTAGGRGARAGRRRALDGGRRPRPHRDARPSRSSSTATAPTSSASTPGSSSRSSASSASAAAGSRCCPARLGPSEVLARDPDLVFLANGPGDPAALDYVVDTVRELVGKRPVFGICLGHQLLCRAVGLETFKLPVRPPRRQPPGQGPRDRAGSTSPPRTTASRSPGPGGERADRGRRAGALGDRLRRRRALAPQPLRPHGRGPRAQRRPRRAPSSTTPRPGPGPHDARYLFDRFLELARDRRALMPRRDDIAARSC